MKNKRNQLLAKHISRITCLTLLVLIFQLSGCQFTSGIGESNPQGKGVLRDVLEGETLRPEQLGYSGYVFALLGNDLKAEKNVKFIKTMFEGSRPTEDGKFRKEKYLLSLFPVKGLDSLSKIEVSNLLDHYDDFLGTSLREAFDLQAKPVGPFIVVVKSAETVDQVLNTLREGRIPKGFSANDIILRKTDVAIYDLSSVRAEEIPGAVNAWFTSVAKYGKDSTQFDRAVWKVQWPIAAEIGGIVENIPYRKLLAIATAKVR